MKRFDTRPRLRQGGAIVVTVSLVLLLLLGFIGFALDLGHLFVIRTELQTALDSCALAAAQELNGEADSLTRAINAGVAAGNANGVDMQSSTWSGKTQVTTKDISFSDQNHNATSVATAARYVRCTHTQSGTRTPLLSMLGAVAGNTAFAGTTNVGAFAEATTTPAQSVCPVPLALKSNLGSKPDYGYTVGQWVTLLNKSGANGQIGWANLDGSTNALETAAELGGHCGTRVGDQLGTPGVQASIGDIWNTRFGMYKNNDGPPVDHPDFTGYVYTTTNWKLGASALSDFIAKRQIFAACDTSVNACQNSTGLNLNAKTLATPGVGGELQTYGVNRRLVAVPVVDSNNKVIDFSCMLMLQPISSPMVDVQLEYVGNASNASSPCTASGLPGGAAGPLVPVLVR